MIHYGFRLVKARKLGDSISFRNSRCHHLFFISHGAVLKAGVQILA